MHMQYFPEAWIVTHSTIVSQRTEKKIAPGAARMRLGRRTQLLPLEKDSYLGRPNPAWFHPVAPVSDTRLKCTNGSRPNRMPIPR